MSFQEALAEEARMRAKYENDTEIAKAKRDYELKKAAYDIEVFTKVIVVFHYCCTHMYNKLLFIVFRS